MQKISEETKAIILDAARRMSGLKKRQYRAQVALKYFKGSARKTERIMGWGRESIEKGIREIETGIRCLDNFHNRGRKKTEELLPGIEQDIRALVEPQTQADPAMKGSLTYTKITAKAVRQALISDKSYDTTQLPSENTIGSMLNRLGYNLKRVIKAKPEKKIKETDEIFENVWEASKKSDNNPGSLRISLDAKAKVNISESSRNGKSRDKEVKKAADHDMNSECKLVPYGILDVVSGLTTFFFVHLLRQVIL